MKSQSSSPTPKRTTNHERRKQLREAAMNRKMARALRPDAEQLAWLESRGHGHCEEATKLRIALARPVINMIPYEKPKKQQTLRRKKVLAEQD